MASMLIIDRTHPVERVDALPRIDWNVLNDVVALTSPPATLQSIEVVNTLL